MSSRFLAVLSVALLAIVATAAPADAQCPGGVCPVSGPSQIVDAPIYPPLILPAAPGPVVHESPPVVHCRGSACPTRHQVILNHVHPVPIRHCRQARFRGSQRWTVGLTVHRQCGPYQYRSRWH